MLRLLATSGIVIAMEVELERLTPHPTIRSKMTTYFTRSMFAALVALTSALSVSALTLGGPDRTFDISPATTGTFGASNNPSATDVGNFAGGTWTSAGELLAGGTNGLFTVNVTSGSFGSGDASGTWNIASGFWSTYGSAVISVHVGQGGGDPDYWMFTIPAGTLAGTWAYDIISGTGGGLSNMKLWGSGTPRVPDGGSTIALLGLGFALLAIARRKLA